MNRRDPRGERRRRTGWDLGTQGQRDGEWAPGFLCSSHGPDVFGPKTLGPARDRKCRQKQERHKIKPLEAQRTKEGQPSKTEGFPTNVPPAAHPTDRPVAPRTPTAAAADALRAPTPQHVSAPSLRLAADFMAGLSGWTAQGRWFFLPRPFEAL